MNDSAADEDLMLRYRTGDARAFEALYVRHKGPLYRYFLRQTHAAAVAEELFQDVWMNVIRARERYVVHAKFTTWLYHIAHNRLVDHYRRSATGVSVADDEDAESLLESVPEAPLHEPDNELDRRRLGQRLVNALATLPAVQREAFLLREEGGLSLEEIAVTTGVEVETAKSRLRYALAKLRRQLHLETGIPSTTIRHSER